MREHEIRLSGGVQVLRDGEPVVLPGRRARALVVLLALSAGQAVSVEQLARGIWDDDPPEHVRASLHTYVGRLRRILGAAVIATRTPGYALALPRAAVDLLRFEDLVRHTAECDTAEDERTRLTSALELWRGEPFGEAPSAWIGRQLAPPWEERHLRALERRIELDISAGEHAARVAELRGLIERHPLRETLWALLLTALDRSGRTAEALHRYEALRVRLAGELGVDPSPEVQRIHQALLTRERPAAPPRTAVVPRQLPPAVGGFTGRASQLADLDAALDDPGGSRVVALHGPGGVGKTTLAVHWAQRARERFPDGQLFVNLMGYGPGEPLGASAALDALLRGIGVHGSRIPADEQALGALLREELADRRMLLVLDNAREAGHVRPLLPGGANAVVVTSRSQLRGLVARDGARRVAVGPLPADDAVALLLNRIGDSDGSVDGELAELAELCGRLPMALAVAAERASRDGRTRLGAVNDQLRDDRERIAALTDWDEDPLTGVRAVFAWSYQVLDPDTARMFRLLGLHPDPQLDVGAAAALAGVGASQAARLLDRLTDRHLLNEAGDGWYESHDLTRMYAVELVEQTESEAARVAVVRRLRNWYLHSARNARYAVRPPIVDSGKPAPLDDPVEAAAFGSEEDALNWFSDHSRVLPSLVAAAAGDGDHVTAATLPLYMSTWLTAHAATSRATELFELADRSARTTGDELVQATTANLLGNAYGHTDDKVSELEHLKRAYRLFTEIGHDRGRLVVGVNLGVSLSREGRLGEAITRFEEARDEAARLGLSEPFAAIENNLASTYLKAGRRREALDLAERAVRRDREGDKTWELATSLVTLGETQVANERWNEAVWTMQEALLLGGRLGFVRSEVLALKHLGVAQRELGRPGEARSAWEGALRRLAELASDGVLDVSAEDLRTLLAALGTAQTSGRQTKA